MMNNFMSDKNHAYGDEKAAEDSWYSDEEVEKRDIAIDKAMARDHLNNPHWEY